MKVNNRDVERAYTATQGQYLGFIYYYTKLHGVPPGRSTQIVISVAAAEQPHGEHPLPCGQPLLPGQQDRTLRNSREEAQNTHKTRRIVVQATYSVVSPTRRSATRCGRCLASLAAFGC